MVKGELVRRCWTAMLSLKENVTIQLVGETSVNDSLILFRSASSMRMDSTNVEVSFLFPYCENSMQFLTILKWGVLVEVEDFDFTLDVDDYGLVGPLRSDEDLGDGAVEWIM